MLLQLKLKLGETILPWLSCNQTDYFENSLKTKSLVPWAIWTATPPVRRKKKKEISEGTSPCAHCQPLNYWEGIPRKRASSQGSE